jgi:hypothetical protein
VLAIASSGDNVVSQDRIRQQLSSDFSIFEGEKGARLFSKLPTPPTSRRAALLFSRDPSEGGTGNISTKETSALLYFPCHISFLSGETNDAMVSFLAPLLPIARLLRVPLLDFDLYASTRDSGPTAEMVLPVIRRFFRGSVGS